ncbi:MAG TPA: TetR/AcrR family transcriptional regulator [Mycobacteriales bacterium]|nr:TetR/AcrR family transcriptional regulator [Mycobacteriales bacterium]
MARGRAHDDELAAQLIDAAGQLLASAGPGGLAVRRVAEAAGTSTMAVYTLFGGKEGMLTSMYEEGFRRLGAALLAVPVTDNPLADLHQLGLAYRQSALASRHLYELMFSHPVPGFSPGPAGRAAADAAYAPMLACVTRCIESGAISQTDPARVALHLWGLAHGLVALELNGWLPEDLATRDALYRSCLTMTGICYVGRPDPDAGSRPAPAPDG